jgi:alkylhydroperoxidase/carboxymuconolactone decarboxylase family protein YurZ
MTERKPLAQWMTTPLPGHYQRFVLAHPKGAEAVAEAYRALGEACHGSGPLDERTRALVKLGIAAGFQHEGAVHSHTRKALEAGAGAAEIRHAVLLAMTTIGSPATMAALSWIEDVLGTS